jgi:AcrR family transcriptional regulator
MAGRARTRRSRIAKAPGRYHHGELRRALVEASIELIGEAGVSALTLRGVARRVGVSHAAPRHHFADKTELLAAVAVEGFEALAEAQREAAARFTDPWDRYKALGIAYVRFAVAHRSQFRVMFGRELAEASPPPLRDYWSTNPAARIHMEAAAEAISSRGEADPERVRTAVIAAWSLVHGLAMLWLDGPLRQLTDSEANDEKFDAIALRVTDFVVDAVANAL